MKMWKIGRWILSGVIVAAGPAGGQANAQDPSHNSEKANEELMHQVAEDVKQAQRSAQDAAKEAAKAAQEELARAGDVQVHINTPNFFFGNPMADKIRKAAEELRDAKDDDAHEKANAKLRELLDKYFEEDMTRRQKELESIETRLQKLHAQLDRRRAKKQDIIDLQVKMSVNEADGLGFYSQPEGPVFNFAAPPPGNVIFRKGPFGDETVTVPSVDAAPPVPAPYPVPAPNPSPR
jgi:hypothetical protein